MARDRLRNRGRNGEEGERNKEGEGRGQKQGHAQMGCSGSGHSVPNTRPGLLERGPDTE